MNGRQRQIFLEGIIYKMFRGAELDARGKKIVDAIVEIRDYGKILD